MLREKRNVKAPTSFEQIYQEAQLKNNYLLKKKPKHNRCEFEMLQKPNKCEDTCSHYPLPGGVVLVEKNGVISSEASPSAKFFNFRSVNVLQKSATKLVQIDVESKDTFKTLGWDQVLQSLCPSGDVELSVWGSTVKKFGAKYDEFVHELTRKNNEFAKNKRELNEQNEITKTTETKKTRLLEFLPCVYYKLRFDKSNIGMTQVSFTNLFLKTLGFSIDSFVTTVFQEGIPQFTSYDSEILQHTTKALLDNYFDLGKEGFNTPELNIRLLMKSGYIRNAKAQSYFFVNYDEGNFGVDVVMSITAQGEPYLDCQLIPEHDVNHEFIQERAQCEVDQAIFLSNYYDDVSFTPRYSYFDKVCQIRELDSTDQYFNS